MVKLETNRGQPCAFWLARVGSLAGKPLKRPYTSNNSFAAISDDPEGDFARLLAAYEGKAFEPYLLGSCQPALRIRDAQAVADKAMLMDSEAVRLVILALRGLEEMEAKLAKLEQLKTAAGQAAYYRVR